MFQVLLVKVLLGFAICHLTIVVGNGICTRLEQVPSTVAVYKTKLVMFTKQGFWGVKYDTRVQGYIDYETHYSSRMKTYCCAGYIKDGDSCEPHCEQPCRENSKCVAPNECQCDTGYIKTGIVCEPQCSDCGINSYCQNPGECVCHEGYVRKGQDCVPECNAGCPENSFCAAPGQCLCNLGYEFSPDGSCEPVCEPSCGPNSHCKEPNVCTCFDGYSGDGCAPICESECGAHSSCIRPGECQCEEGYAKPTNESNPQCLPVCKGGCPLNSECVDPDKCVCNPGYQMNRAQQCEPHCSKGCSVYGKCVLPEVCECFEGYEEAKAEQSIHECQPKCSSGCVNGICLAPELCTCDPGYWMGPNQTCIARCSKSCEYGDCTEPETCSCLAGYRFAQNSDSICEPICDPECEQGMCLGPNVCICNFGYEPLHDTVNSHKCKPSCEKPCENATCTATNVCTCNEGFVRNGDRCEEQENEVVLITSTESSEESTSLNCTNICKCWNEYDNELGSSHDLKCMNICIDDFDQPCLHLADCHCDEMSGHLICNASNDTIHYACKAIQPTSTPKIITEYSASSKVASRNFSYHWIWVIVGCAILAIAVVAIFLKYRARRTFSINHPDEFEGCLNETL